MKRLARFSFSVLVFFLPTQFGKHFWPDFSLVLGRRVDYLSPTIFTTDILLILTFVMVMVAIKPKIPARPIFYSIVGLIFVAFNVLISDQPISTIYTWFKFWEIVLLATVVVLLRPKLVDILVPLSFGIILQAVLATAQFLSQQSIGGIWYFLGERRFDLQTIEIAHLVSYGRLLVRSYGTFSHPNVLAGFVLASLPLFFFFSPASKLTYILKWVALSATTVLLFISFSRHAWLVGAIFILRMLIKKQKFRWFLVLVALGIFQEILVGRLFLIFSQDLTQRWQMTVAAVRLFLSSPLLGVGLGQYINEFVKISSSPYLLQPVHSIYLLVASETGLLGLAFFWLVVFRLFKKAKNSAFVWCLAIVLLLGIFDHYFFTQQQTRLFLGLICGLAMLRARP